MRNCGRNRWLRFLVRIGHHQNILPSVVCILQKLIFKGTTVFYRPIVYLLENVWLSCPRLTANAVPSIFPNLLSYFTKRVLPPRKNPVQPEQEILQKHENLVLEFTNSDFISNFPDLINNFKEKLAISNCWTIKITNSKFYFCMLVCNDDSDFLVLNTQIVISDNMKLQVFQEGNEVSFNDLKWVLSIDKKLSRWSQLQNILSRYKVLHNAHSNTDICLNEKHLEKFLEELNKAYIIAESIDFAYTTNLEIVTDQEK